MRLIDAGALRKNSKMLYSIHAFEPVEWYTQDQIDAQPTIDAAPVAHGQWVEFWDEARGKRYGCSVCAASVAVQTDYCPHCGAKMDAPDRSGV